MDLIKLGVIALIFNFVFIMSTFMVQYTSVTDNFTDVVMNKSGFSSLQIMNDISREFMQSVENTDSTFSKSVTYVSGAVESILKPFATAGAFISLIFNFGLSPIAVFLSGVGQPTYMIYLIVSLFVGIINIYLIYNLWIFFKVGNKS